MLPSITAILLDLVNHIAILFVVIYIITQTGIFTDIDQSRVKLKTKLFIVLLFGLFAIYATLNSIEILGAKANVRDLGPMIAGLIAGPWAGLGAGLIGGIHRYLFGGLTKLPCALATILAGLAGGIVFKINKGALLKPWTCALFAVAMESIHMLLVLGLAKPYSQASMVVKQIALPMILCNAIGLALFSSIVRSYKRGKEIKASQEQIAIDLKAAHEIQLSMLPRIFPPFPDRKEFSLFATMEPAKQVGGDFYDFFFMDDEHLCFAVGDVSDKGVPASLFMAITKTLIKIKATKGLTSDMILTRVNEDLALDNPSVMFVTLFLGIFNVRTGVLEYCNGGHNPPYIIHENGDLEKLEMTQGMALGVMEGFIYTSKMLTLRKGETLFMYTDGVTEAINKETELFSEKRLEKELGTLKEKPLEALIGGVMDKVKTFSHGMPQTDDIAMMALRYYGTKPEEAI